MFVDSSFVRVERLDEVVIRARLEASDAIGDFASAGEHERGRVDAALSQFFDDLESVHERQHRVALLAERSAKKSD